MAKRRDKPGTPAPAKRKETPFHSPFAELARKKREEASAAERAAEAERAREAAARAAGAPRRSRLADPPPPVDDADDASLFLRAVEGARAIPEVERAVVERAPTPPREAPLGEEVETMARLADLCAGSGPFDLADTTEYIEGTAPGVDHRLVRRLRKGEFSVQAHLDLHGMTRDEAREAALAFLVRARARGLRCVLLVHGRGHNSKDNIPVLKQAVASWLQRGRLARLVLAFATARPHDGGAGAIYVLLRR